MTFFSPNICWQLKKTKKCLYWFKHHSDRPHGIYTWHFIYALSKSNCFFFPPEKNILQQNGDWKLGFGDLFVWKHQMSRWALRNSKRQFSVFSAISDKTWRPERKQSLANREMTTFLHISSRICRQISRQTNGILASWKILWRPHGTIVYISYYTF